MRRIVSVTVLLTLTAACGDPRPLTADRQDFNQAELNNDDAFLLAPTESDRIPNATATYDGQFTSDANINGEGGYLLVGDIELTANFGAGSRRTIDGTIDDINLIDRFNADRRNSQQLRGSLDIDGLTNRGAINGDARGELKAVLNNDGFLRTSDVDLDLDADVVGPEGETIFGTLAGEGRGAFDIELTGLSEFTATRD